MRGIVLTRYGNPADVLKVVTVDDPPPPGAGEVVIRVTKRVIHPGNLSLVRGHFHNRELTKDGLSAASAGLSKRRTGAWRS